MPLPFSDVSDKSWYSFSVSYLLQSGIIMPGEEFSPEALITIGEFEKWLGRAINNSSAVNIIKLPNSENLDFQTAMVKFCLRINWLCQRDTKYLRSFS